MAEKNNFPIIDGEASCLAFKEGGEKQPYVREQTREFLKNLEKDYDRLYVSFEAAFKNLYPETFLDKKFLEE